MDLSWLRNSCLCYLQLLRSQSILRKYSMLTFNAIGEPFSPISIFCYSFIPHMVTHFPMLLPCFVLSILYTNHYLYHKLTILPGVLDSLSCRINSILASPTPVEETQATPASFPNLLNSTAARYWWWTRNLLDAVHLKVLEYFHISHLKKWNDLVQEIGR